MVMISPKGRRAEMEASIVASATRLFSAAGYDSPTLRQITRDAGVSLPIVYWFFADKRDLYVECCLRTILNDQDAIWAHIAKLEDAREILVAYTLKSAQLHLEDGSIKLIHRLLLDRDAEILERAADVLFQSPAYKKVLNAARHVAEPALAETNILLLISVIAGIIEHSGIWALAKERTAVLGTAQGASRKALEMVFPAVDWEEPMKNTALVPAPVSPAIPNVITTKPARTKKRSQAGEAAPN